MGEKFGMEESNMYKILEDGSFLLACWDAAMGMVKYVGEHRKLRCVCLIILLFSACIVPKIRWRYQRFTMFKGTPMPQHSIQFRLVERDFPDEVLEKLFAKMLDETRELAIEFLAKDDWPSFDLHEFYLRLSPELLKYLKALVWPDKNLEDWSGLFRRRWFRTCLCEAIILRTLHTHVFQELLFGASREHREMLETMDIEMMEIDGFERSKMRAVTNLSYLRNRALSHIHSAEPPHFWREVNKISAQLMTMLLPLLGVDYDCSQGCYREPASLNTIYNRVHRLISRAAFLSIVIRCSPKIVDYTWLQPGDLYEFGQADHHHALYEQSRDATEAAQKQSHNENPLHARVHVSVAPAIRSYCLTSETARGQPSTRVYEIQKPHAVYYHGMMDDEKNDQEYIPLKSPDFRFYMRYYWKDLAILGISLIAVAVDAVVF